MRPYRTPHRCGTHKVSNQAIQSLEEQIEKAGGLKNFLEKSDQDNPEFTERCRQAGHAAWAISCMRKAFGRLGFKSMPLLDFIRYLADGVQNQPEHTGEEIANIAIVHFHLDAIVQNLTEVCRVCKWLGLTHDQTLDLCLASDLELIPAQEEGLAQAIYEEFQKLV